MEQPHGLVKHQTQAKRKVTAHSRRKMAKGDFSIVVLGLPWPPPVHADVASIATPLLYKTTSCQTRPQSGQRFSKYYFDQLSAQQPQVNRGVHPVHGEHFSWSIPMSFYIGIVYLCLFTYIGIVYLCLFFIPMSFYIGSIPMSFYIRFLQTSVPVSFYITIISLMTIK